MGVNYAAKLSGQRILVTGATGFIGQHVVAQGIAAGLDLVLLTSTGSAVPDSIRRQCVNADLRIQESVDRAVDAIQPQDIVHLAAMGVTSGTANLSLMLEVNVAGLARLLTSATRLSTVRHVVVVGSGAEYSPQMRPIREDDPVEPTTLYGVSKLAATNIARLYGRQLPITVVRPFNVYGPGEPLPRLGPYLVSCAKNGVPAELTLCEQIRDYTSVAGVADALWNILAYPAAGKSFRILNLGSGTSILLRSYVQLVAESLAIRGLPLTLDFGAKPYRPGEPMMYVANVDRLVDVIGFRPEADFDNGINQMVDTILRADCE